MAHHPLVSGRFSLTTPEKPWPITRRECKNAMKSTITLLGDPLPTGSYLLAMALAAPLRLRFGRFRGGTAVALAAGSYVYVGSALGQRGSGTLARRLVRHATRASGPPHGVRSELERTFGVAPPASKTLRWHVDYVLESTAVTLQQVYVVFTDVGVEQAIAGMLAADPHTRIPAAGLGAGDNPGATHLLWVDAPRDWWADLPRRLRETGQ